MKTLYTQCKRWVWLMIYKLSSQNDHPYILILLARSNSPFSTMYLHLFKNTKKPLDDRHLEHFRTMAAYLYFHQLGKLCSQKRNETLSTCGDLFNFVENFGSKQCYREWQPRKKKNSSEFWTLYLFKLSNWWERLRMSAHKV